MNHAILIEISLLGAVLVVAMSGMRLWYHRRLQQEHFRYFVDSPDLLCTADFHGHFKSVNAAFLRTLGYTHSEMCHQPFLAFVHEGDRQATIDASQTLSEGGGVNEFENRYRCKDGSWKWLLWNSKSDRVHGIIFASAKDITRRKELEVTLISSQAALTQALAAQKDALTALEEKAKALAKSNQELASFAHVVAHDLQEPLRTITSYSAILEENHRGALNAEAFEVLSFITDASSRMKALIRDLLLYGRIDEQNVKSEIVPLMEAMDDVRSMLRVAIDEAHAVIEYDGLPEVYADRRHIVQLLQNLLGNAVKYRGAANPIIRVTAMMEGDFIHLSVQDNGIGIAQRHHQRIFGMFKRLHTREKYEGTGIGLALCKKITDIVKGKIWVESELGHGATFHVTLPAIPQNACLEHA